MRIFSSAFSDGDWIPTEYTQLGENISPPLAFEDIPQYTKSLCLLCLDPDAPDPKAPKKTFTHWIVYNLAPDISELQKGVSFSEHSSGIKEGFNDRGTVGYIGPKPPIGTHRYYFMLYALDSLLEFSTIPDHQMIIEKINGKVIFQAETMGRFGQPE